MSVEDRRREGPAAAGVHEPDGLQGGRFPVDMRLDGFVRKSAIPGTSLAARHPR